MYSLREPPPKKKWQFYLNIIINIFISFIRQFVSFTRYERVLKFVEINNTIKQTNCKVLVKTHFHSLNIYFNDIRYVHNVSLNYIDINNHFAVSVNHYKGVLYSRVYCSVTKRKSNICSIIVCFCTFDNLLFVLIFYRKYCHQQNGRATASISPR